MMSFVDNPFAEDEETSAEVTLPSPSLVVSTAQKEEMEVRLPDKPFSEYDAAAREDAYNALIIEISKLETELQEFIASSQAKLAQCVRQNEALRLSFNRSYESAAQEEMWNAVPALRLFARQIVSSDPEEWRRRLDEMNMRCRRYQDEMATWRAQSTTLCDTLRDQPVNAHDTAVRVSGDPVTSFPDEPEALPAYKHDGDLLRALIRTLCENDLDAGDNAESEFVLSVMMRLQEAVSLNETLYKTYRARRGEAQRDDADACSACGAAAELSRWVAQARVIDAVCPRPEVNAELEWANARLQGEVERLEFALQGIDGKAAIDPAIAVVYSGAAIGRRCAVLRAKNAQLAAEVRQRRSWLRRGSTRELPATTCTREKDLTKVNDAVTDTNQANDEAMAEAVATYQAALVARYTQLTSFAQALLHLDDTNIAAIAVKETEVQSLSLTAAQAEVVEQLLPLQDSCMHILGALNATLRRQACSAATLAHLVLHEHDTSGLLVNYDTLLEQEALATDVMHEWKSSIVDHLHELAAEGANKTQLDEFFSTYVRSGVVRGRRCVRRLQRVRDMLLTLLELRVGGDGTGDVNTTPAPNETGMAGNDTYIEGLSSQAQPPRCATPPLSVTLTESHESEVREEVARAEEHYVELAQRVNAVKKQRHTERVKRACWLQSQRFGPLYARLYTLCMENDTLREQSLEQTSSNNRPANVRRTDEDDELMILEEQIAKEQLRARALQDELQLTMQHVRDAQPVPAVDR